MNQFRYPGAVYWLVATRRSRPPFAGSTHPGGRRTARNRLTDVNSSLARDRALFHSEFAMNVFVRRVGLAAAALSFVSVTAPTVSAQALPDAKDLIQKYNEAIGGGAWKTHTSARMKGTLEVPAAGMRADIEAMNIFATKTFLMKTTIPGMGEMLAGFDGTTAWSKEPMSGARILTGVEGEQAAEEADPEASTRTSANITKSET